MGEPPAEPKRLPLAKGNGASPAPKRRLPMLQNDEVVEGDEDRPPWHWSAIGAVGIFLVWLPLAAGVGVLARRVLGSDTNAPPPFALPIVVGLHASAFALASFAGGALVGRFGGAAGRKEATVSGGAAAMIAWGIGAMTGAASGLLIWALLLVLLAAIGAASSYAGGRVGLRLRNRQAP